MAQDRFGRWQWPIDLVAVTFNQFYEAKRMSLTHCPWCNELLPNVSDAKPYTEPGYPPPADAVGDGNGQADGEPDGN